MGNRVKYPIVGMMQDRSGRTLVAAQNGIFELRSHLKGDELVPLATAGEAAIDEALKHERDVADETRRIVEASRSKEATHGQSPDVPQGGNEKDAKEEVHGEAVESNDAERSPLLRPQGPN